MTRDSETTGWVPATFLEPLDGSQPLLQPLARAPRRSRTRPPDLDPEDEEVHSNAIPGNGKDGVACIALCLSKRLTSSPLDEKYIATSKFEAANADEIAFDKGVVLTVVEKKLDGWWLVAYQGKEGWAPGSYLKRLEVQEYKASGVLETDGPKTPAAASSAKAPAAAAVVKLRPKKEEARPPPRRVGCRETRQG